jgi:hypothetical protein
MPVSGITHAWFTFSAMQMVAASVAGGVEIEHFMRDSSSISENRSHLVIQAAQSGADAMLFLDSDHTFPADALLRLIGHQKPVVGANYTRRMNPANPTASKAAPGGEYVPVHTTKALAEAGELEQVAALGLGLCLIQMAPLGPISWPLFQENMNGSRLGIGEDVFFFRKLEAAGVPVFVDHALSWEVGHIASRVITNADSERLN